jgi:hypothetical protein
MKLGPASPGVKSGTAGLDQYDDSRHDLLEAGGPSDLSDAVILRKLHSCWASLYLPRLPTPAHACHA